MIKVLSRLAVCLILVEVIVADTARPEQPSCPCTGEREWWDPVCGEDGRTYSNPCEARCVHNTTVGCYGRCPCRSLCQLNCDDWGVIDCGGGSEENYNNVCVEGCDKLKIKCEGKCPAKIEPVCDEIGNSYSNAYVAKHCGKAKIKCHGRCPCDKTTCPRLCKRWSDIKSPVCGADGKTYPNGCLTKCKDIRVKCRGKCPCKEE